MKNNLYKRKIKYPFSSLIANEYNNLNAKVKKFNLSLKKNTILRDLLTSKLTQKQNGK